jgi:hypothetical protein
MVLLTATVCRMHDAMGWSSAVSILMLMIFSVIVAATLVLHYRPFIDTAGRLLISTPGRWVVSSIAGLALVTVASQLFAFNALNTFWLAFAGLPIFAIAYRSRDAIPAAAGGIPLVFSWIAFVALAFNRELAWQSHLVATLGLMTVNFTTAYCLGRSESTAKSLVANIFERLLHIASLSIGFVFFHEHLDSPTTCAASLGLTLAAMLAAHFLPFRQLAIASILPAILAATSQLVEHGWEPHHQPVPSWWLTLAAIPIAFVIWEKFLLRAGRLSAERAPFSGQFITFIPALLGVTSLVFVRGAFADPWQPLGYAIVGLTGLALWRLAKFSHHSEWPALPMLLSAISVISLSVQTSGEAESATGTLVACILAIVGVLLYGLLLSARRSHPRPLSLVPAAVGTALAFWVFSGSNIGVGKIATVCWGVTAILVFVAGLAGGLRNYRLVGLVGLGLCLIRMFLVDIDDTLYRIIAFFVIAVVLLLIGYLYHRFRHLIEVFDEREGKNEAGEAQTEEKNTD